MVELSLKRFLIDAVAGGLLCNRLNRVIPTNLLGFSLKKLPSVFSPPLLIAAPGRKNANETT